MVDYLFILVFLAFPLVINLILQYVGIEIRRIEILTFTILSIFVFGYLGILPLYFGWDEYRFLIGVQDRILVMQVLLYAMTSICCLIVGYLMAYSSFGGTNPIYEMHRGLNKRELFTISLLLILTLLVVVLYVCHFDNLAIVVAITSGFKRAAVVRSQMGNNFPGKYHWYQIVMHDIANILTYILFASWLKFRGRIVLFLFFAGFLISSFTSLMAIEKAPFVWLIVSLFVTYTLVKLDGIIQLKGVLKLTLIVIVFLIIFYLYFTGSHSLQQAFFSVLSRAFTGEIAPAYFYLEFFPAHHDFLLGSSFPNPGGIFPYEPYHLTVEIMNWKHPDLQNIGIVGSMPTAFWGELYANFGSWGVVLGSLIMGFWIQRLCCFINKVECSPVKIGLLVWCLMHYKNLAVSGFSGFIIDIHLFSIFSLIYVIMILSKNTGPVLQRHVIYSRLSNN